ncbi:zf-HC2 domain-containing protein [Cellulomonas fimi]|uniref:Sigma-70 family RNA polymerase sigma factor n=1 Tax=Cellulomonas fimi TaxID=1708 RepID=A0A7Y0LZV2_CELFI|nr:zf-HC2 domain-containing protein [Cellulomonas fimi]NMR20991.1 sigma-70 family RNA polymerase sigma factor [Cellulomonas fimi]
MSVEPGTSAGRGRHAEAAAPGRPAGSARPVPENGEMAGKAEPSDVDLVDAAQRHVPGALEALHQRHSDAARVVARQYTASDADADALVSRALAGVDAAVRGGAGPEVTYRLHLLAAVRRLAVARWRAGDAGSALPAAGSSLPRAGSELPSRFDAAGALGAGVAGGALVDADDGPTAAAFASLPERWQALLWYVEVDQLPPAQVGRLLGLTVAEVVAQTHLAREGLRNGLLARLDAAATPECEAVRGLLSGYVRGQLGRRDTTRVREHLDVCEQCRATTRDLQDVDHDVRGVVAPLVIGAGVLGALAGPLPVGGVTVGAGGLGASGGGALGMAAAAGADTGAGVMAGAGAVGAGAGAGAGADGVEGAGVAAVEAAAGDASGGAASVGESAAAEAAVSGSAVEPVVEAAGGVAAAETAGAAVAASSVPVGVVAAATAGVVAVSLAVAGVLDQQSEDDAGLAGAPEESQETVEEDDGGAGADDVLTAPEPPPVEAPALEPPPPGAEPPPTPEPTPEPDAEQAPPTSRSRDRQPPAEAQGPAVTPVVTNDAVVAPVEDPPLAPAPDPANLSVSFPGDTVALTPGAVQTLDVGMVNTGDAVATELRAELTMPDGVVMDGVPAGDGWVQCGDAPVQLCLAELPAGASSSLGVPVRVEDTAAVAPGAAVVVTLTAAGVDPVELVVPVSVAVAEPELTVGAPEGVVLVVGEPLRVGFTVGNAAEAPAVDVEAVVSLPPGVRWAGSAGEAAGWVCESGDAGVRCSVAEISGASDGVSSELTLPLTLVAGVEAVGVPGLVELTVRAESGGSTRTVTTAVEVVEAVPVVEPPPVVVMEPAPDGVTEPPTG